MSAWISVDDFLPGLSVDWCIVLIKSKDNVTFSYMANYHHSDGKWGYFDTNFEQEMKVIYWMPMPELPDIE